MTQEYMMQARAKNVAALKGVKEARRFYSADGNEDGVLALEEVKARKRYKRRQGGNIRTGSMLSDIAVNDIHVFV